MAKALQVLRSIGLQTKDFFRLSFNLQRSSYGYRKLHMSSWIQSEHGSRIPSAHIDGKNKWLNLKWDGEQSKNYPYVWLRDNCRCRECYHEIASQKLFQFNDLDIDVEANDIHFTDDGTAVIHFSDGHKGKYPLSFLEGEKFPAFSDPLRQLNKELWGSELQGAIPTFQFSDVMTDDDVLLGWLTVLHTKGIAILQNAGTIPTEVKKIGDRVAYLRATYYGETFQVMSKNDPNSITYTDTAIDFHTDICAMYNQPGMQMLHCIKQSTEGGENQLVDTYKVVEDLKKEEPEVHSILSSTLFEFTDIGTDILNDFHFRSSKPAISYGFEGNINQVSIHFSRHHSMNVPPEQVYPVYSALKVLSRYLYHEENIVRHRLSPGEILCMDNRRLAHARTKYYIDPTIKGVQRQLAGGYMDWDELSSFYRVLLEKKKKNENSN
ncbi:gamma-butyrobetaine dioxygenase-like [Anneissia japonica]|uniref:gamma-butyrobetaine dioxygenase-like n=1 Tax=Anneissia japonica TaxID=1529436 RepID=UPI0014258896|nr:gamma-butyrobetaine dioxygenase-like [Anneissia japonica]